MFPPWLTVILLVALLGYSGRRTLNKGIKRWKGEDKQSPRPTLEEASLGDIEIDTPLGHDNAPPIAREDPCGSRPHGLVDGVGAALISHLISRRPGADS